MASKRENMKYSSSGTPAVLKYLSGRCTREPAGTRISRTDFRSAIGASSSREKYGLEISSQYLLFYYLYLYGAVSAWSILLGCQHIYGRGEKKANKKEFGECDEAWSILGVGFLDPLNR